MKTNRSHAFQFSNYVGSDVLWRFDRRSGFVSLSCLSFDRTVNCVIGYLMLPYQRQSMSLVKKFDNPIGPWRSLRTRIMFTFRLLLLNILKLIE